jgi:hypothetical protein
LRGEIEEKINKKRLKKKTNSEKKKDDQILHKNKIK